MFRECSERERVFFLNDLGRVQDSCATEEHAGMAGDGAVKTRTPQRMWGITTYFCWDSHEKVRLSPLNPKSFYVFWDGYQVSH